MPAWLAVPASTIPVPGVVVLHDVLGMSQDHRNQANWLAEAGFLAVSPDLYYKGGRLVCIRQVIRDMIACAGPAFDRFIAAMQIPSPAGMSPSAAKAATRTMKKRRGKEA